MHFFSGLGSRSGQEDGSPAMFPEAFYSYLLEMPRLNGLLRLRLELWNSNLQANHCSAVPHFLYRGVAQPTAADGHELHLKANGRNMAP